MDSLTQIVLGSSVAALSVPAAQRRSALLAGGVLGTVPDLDYLYFFLRGSDVVTEITWHRGPSHSLFVLFILATLLWWWAKTQIRQVALAPRQWLWAIWLALLTHPILDAFTVYGTQLLWPIPMQPVIWSSIYIIDPLYSLPLLIAVLISYWLSSARAVKAAHPCRRDKLIRRSLSSGLLLSSAYLAWSVCAKYQVEHIAKHSLRAQGLEHAPRLSTPTPLNTLLWRVIVMDADGYWIGDRSLLVDRGPMQFRFYPSEVHLLTDALRSADLQRLIWFSHGFIRIYPQQGTAAAPQLILADLRMGLEPDYFFRYQFASMDAQGQWHALPEIRLLDSSEHRFRGLRWMWRRIYTDETQQP